MLIHGAGGSHLSWPLDLRRLSPTTTTYLPDLPGHGRSAGSGLASVEGFSDVILQFCHLLNLKDVALIGHSMGGAVALAVALHRPDLCRFLVLLNSAARFDVPRAIREALNEDQQRAIEVICEHAFAPEPPTPWFEATRSMMLDLPFMTLRNDYLACQDFDAVGQLRAIQAPTLIVGAADDVLTPPQSQYLLAEQIPQSKLVMVRNAGHMAALTHAEEIRKQILNFLRLTKC